MKNKKEIFGIFNIMHMHILNMIMGVAFLFDGWSTKGLGFFSIGVIGLTITTSVKYIVESQKENIDRLKTGEKDGK